MVGEEGNRMGTGGEIPAEDGRNSLPPEMALGRGQSWEMSCRCGGGVWMSAYVTWASIGKEKQEWTWTLLPEG